MALPRALCGGFPRAQNRVIELHDSKLRSWERMPAGELVLRLSAVVHVSAGAPGVAAGTVWAQEISLRIAAASLAQEPLGPLWIDDGWLEIGEQRLESLLPFPLEKQGPVRIRLFGGEGELCATGDGVILETLGEPTFIERFEKA